MLFLILLGVLLLISFFTDAPNADVVSSPAGGFLLPVPNRMLCHALWTLSSKHFNYTFVNMLSLRDQAANVTHVIICREGIKTLHRNFDCKEMKGGMMRRGAIVRQSLREFCAWQELQTLLCQRRETGLKSVYTLGSTSARTGVYINTWDKREECLKRRNALSLR